MIMERFGHHRAQLEAPLILEIHNFQIVLVTVWQFVSFILTTRFHITLKQRKNLRAFYLLEMFKN